LHFQLVGWHTLEHIVVAKDKLLSINQSAGIAYVIMLKDKIPVLCDCVLDFILCLTFNQNIATVLSF